MKMYLRRQTDRFYYTGETGAAMWSLDQKKAREFLSFTDVDSLCGAEKLKDMEIVAKFRDGEVVITVRPPQ